MRLRVLRLLPLFRVRLPAFCIPCNPSPQYTAASWKKLKGWRRLVWISVLPTFLTFLPCLFLHFLSSFFKMVYTYDNFCVENCSQRAQVTTPDGCFEITWYPSEGCVAILYEDGIEPFRCPYVQNTQITYQHVLWNLGYLPSEFTFTVNCDGDITKPVMQEQLFQILVQEEN